jgi:hypothetical protein
VYCRQYNPNTSIFAGMTTEQLQAALASAQAAYIALSTGQQGVDFSYNQAGGAKHVRYKETDLPTVINLIQQLQAQLGIVQTPRRAMRFVIR